MSDCHSSLQDCCKCWFCLRKICLHGTTIKPSLVCLSLSKKIWSGIIFCLWSFQTWLHQHVVLLLLAKANKLLNRQFLEWFQQQPVLIIMLSVQCDAVDACQRVKLYVLHLHWALVLVSWISVLAILGWGTWPAVVSDQYWYWGWPARVSSFSWFRAGVRHHTVVHRIEDGKRKVTENEVPAPSEKWCHVKEIPGVLTSMEINIWVGISP